MEKRIGQKLVSLMGLMIFGFIIFLGFYHFSKRFASRYSVHNLMGKGDRTETFHNEILPAESVGGKLVFRLNQARSIGKVKLTYRGLEGKSICLIDVIIPELDPERPYKYRLDIEAAEKGFRMAGQQFRLLDTGDDSIRLIRVSR